MLDSNELATDCEELATDHASYRPVAIVNAGARKLLELRVEVPVEDMARLGAPENQPTVPDAQTSKRTSIWQSIYPSGCWRSSAAALRRSSSLTRAESRNGWRAR